MSRYSDAEIATAIEEMMGMSHYVEKFIFDGVDTDGLVRLVLSRGLPLRDRTASDDALIDAYDAQIDALGEAFTTWAKGGRSADRPNSPSRVEKYLDYLMENVA